MSWKGKLANLAFSGFVKAIDIYDEVYMKRKKAKQDHGYFSSTTGTSDTYEDQAQVRQWVGDRTIQLVEPPYQQQVYDLEKILAPILEKQERKLLQEIEEQEKADVISVLLEIIAGVLYLHYKFVVAYEGEDFVDLSEPGDTPEVFETAYQKLSELKPDYANLTPRQFVEKYEKEKDM